MIAPVLVTDGTLIVEGVFNDIGEEYSSGIEATHWKPKSPNYADNQPADEREKGTKP